MSRVILAQRPGLLELLKVCFDLPEDERNEYRIFAGREFDPEQVAIDTFQKAGPRWGLFPSIRPEAPIVIAGFDLIRTGVWQTWMLPGPLAFTEYARETTIYTRRVMDAMLKSDAHRLQCICSSGRIQAHKWYSALGLTVDGPLKGFGVAGQDAIMFSRTRALPGVQ